MITYQETDLNRKLANSAHRGTSHTPEVRGGQEIDSYMAEMESVSAQFAPFATSENEVPLRAALEQYRIGYLKHLNARLAAKSNCLSTMITGAANFNHTKNRKANDTEHRRTTELLEWRERALKRLRRDYDPAAIARRPIRSDEADVIERLQARIDAAEKDQATMISANKIIRSKKDSKEVKLEKLIEAGFSEASALKLFEPDFAGRGGYPAYKLKNNNANIKRMERRVASLQAEAARPVAEDRQASIDGTPVTIVENREEERLQLLFDGKPPDEVIVTLKRNGFHWSWTEDAWQRLLNDNARRVVEEITE